MTRIDAMKSRILDMLSYRRPSGSQSEAAFINRFIRPLPNATRDAFGNWHVVIGNNPSLLFSAHTDSVHRCEGRQKVKVSAAGLATIGDTPIVNTGTWKGKTYTWTSTRGGCLGADDAAGCYLLIELIRARVAGRYVFHRAEEKGGIGSSALVRSNPSWLPAVQFAIAFDRRGYSDVITHQAAGRSASDAFAIDLSAKLNALDATFAYVPSDEGIFTDTANYADDVPECTNISVGYWDEHRSSESQDLNYLCKLRDAVVKLDWQSLVCDRTAGDWQEYGYTPDMRRWLTADEIEERYSRLDIDGNLLDSDDDEDDDEGNYSAIASISANVAASTVIDRDVSPIYLSDEYAKVQEALAEDIRIRAARASIRLIQPSKEIR